MSTTRGGPGLPGITRGGRLFVSFTAQYAYIAFAGESLGFRKAETIITALEAELAFYGQIMGFTPPGVAPVPLA